MREMGANTIRLTHYQHGQAIHDLADRYGLVLWDEIPLVSAWTLAAAQTRPRRARRQRAPAAHGTDPAELQPCFRRRLGHRQRGRFRQLAAGLPDRRRDGPAPDPMPCCASSTPWPRRGSSRPTALATCCEGVSPRAARCRSRRPPTDLGGANRYFGWYFGVPEDLGPHLDALHAKRPDQPLAVTEYGAGGATTIHTDDARAAPSIRAGAPSPRNTRATSTSGTGRRPRAKPYLWATWLWNELRLRHHHPARGRRRGHQHQGPRHLRPQDPQGRLLLLQGELDDHAHRPHQRPPLRRSRVSGDGRPRLQQRAGHGAGRERPLAGHGHRRRVSAEDLRVEGRAPLGRRQRDRGEGTLRGGRRRGPGRLAARCLGQGRDPDRFGCAGGATVVVGLGPLWIGRLLRGRGRRIRQRGPGVRPAAGEANDRRDEGLGLGPRGDLPRRRLPIPPPRRERPLRRHRDVRRAGGRAGANGSST